jgi:hypothetical protein
VGDAPGPAGTDPQNQENVQDGTMPVHAGSRPGLKGVHPHRRHTVERAPQFAELNMASILSYRPDEEKVAEWHTVRRSTRSPSSV